MRDEYESKGEFIKDLILNLEEPARFSEICDRFVKLTKLKVTPQRVGQVAKELDEEGLVELRKREENGNLVNYVKPLNRQSP